VYGLPFVVTAHGTDTAAAAVDRRYRRLLRDGLRRAAAITAVASDVRDQIGAYFGRDLIEKTHVISGGVDTETFRPTSSADELRAELGLGDRQVVLFAGKLNEGKGVDVLLRAAPGIPADVVIIGDGDDRPSLELTAKSLGLTGIRFEGHKERARLPSYYTLADVVVMPSTWGEPFGLVTLEAMACGTPVVAVRTPATEKIIRPGENGYLVEAGDESDLRAKINGVLMDNAPLKGRMSASARSTVVDNFGWQSVGKQIEPLLRDAIDTAGDTP
jgi:phosphatidylinositol alpha-1,6-mannosyltransferase